MLGVVLMVIVLLPMATNWGILFQFAIGLLTAAVAYYGHIQIKKGRDSDRTQRLEAEREARQQAEDDAEAADRKQRFSELQTSLLEARQDLAYKNTEVDRARARAEAAEAERVRLESEWVRRHNATLERCAATAAQLKELLGDDVAMPAAQRARLNKAVTDVEQHIREDHQDYVEGI